MESIVFEIEKAMSAQGYDDGLVSYGRFERLKIEVDSETLNMELSLRNEYGRRVDFEFGSITELKISNYLNTGRWVSLEFLDERERQLEYSSFYVFDLEYENSFSFRCTAISINGSLIAGFDKD